MGLHGAYRHIQPLTDLGIGEPESHHPQHFELAIGKLTPRSGRPGGGRIRSEQGGTQRGCTYCFAAGHLSDSLTSSTSAASLDQVAGRFASKARRR